MNEISILDIISPIMVGPSSSHTAGAVRIGLLAKNIYEKEIKKVKIILYNSYAKTGPGHGTDKGIIAGLLGYSVDNTIIKDIFKTPEASKLEYSFEFEESFTHHPNSVEFIFDDMTISAKSIGGGEVEVDKINNFSLSINGKYNVLVLVVKDEPSILSKITNIIQKNNINIASISCDRYARGKNTSCCIALDGNIQKTAIEEIKKSVNPCLIRYVQKLEN